MTNRIRYYTWAILASAAMAGCATNKPDNAEYAILQTRGHRFDKAVKDTSTEEDKPIARWVMPQILAEISGLALTPDGRLLAHGDETAEISQIDYRRGVIVKRFLLGDKVLRGDFEGITVVDDRIFMMTSDGHLYEFREGQNKAQVPYIVHDAHLGKECELEGVVYDRNINALVMPCKVVKLPELEGQFVMYKWSLDSTANPRVTHINVPLKSVIGSENWDSFHSSDITIDPKTGNYVLVAAQEKGLIVIKPTGEGVSARELDDVHNQVEGVAITRDGVLILSDEVGKSKPAAITLYHWR